MRCRTCRLSTHARVRDERRPKHRTKALSSSDNGLMDTLKTLQEVQRRSDAPPWTAEEVLLGLPWLAEMRKRSESSDRAGDLDPIKNEVKLSRGDSRTLESCFTLADAMYEMWNGDKTDVDEFLSLLDNVRYEDVLAFEPRSREDLPAHSLLVVHDMKAVVLVVRGTEGRDSGVEEKDSDEELVQDQGDETKDRKDKKKKNNFGFGFIDSDEQGKEKEETSSKGYGYGVLRPDVLTDLSATPEPFQAGGNGAYAHGGMLRAAEIIVNNHFDDIVACLQRPACKGYGVLTTGHSLGAGVAVLSATLLRDRFSRRNAQPTSDSSRVASVEIEKSEGQAKPVSVAGMPSLSAKSNADVSNIQGVKRGRASYKGMNASSLFSSTLFGTGKEQVSGFLPNTSVSPDVRCVAFATPAILSLEAARNAARYTTSIVGGDDAVPNMSVRSIECLHAELRSLDWKRGVRDEVASPLDALFRDSLGNFWGSFAEDKIDEKEHVEKSGEKDEMPAPEAGTETGGFAPGLAEVVGLWRSAWDALDISSNEDESSKEPESEPMNITNDEDDKAFKTLPSEVDTQTNLDLDDQKSFSKVSDGTEELAAGETSQGASNTKSKTTDSSRGMSQYRLPLASPYVPRDVPEGFCLYPAGIVLWLQDVPKGVQESGGGRIRVLVSDPGEFECLPLSEQGLVDHLSRSYWRRLRLMTKYAGNAASSNSYGEIKQLYEERKAHNDAVDAKDKAMYETKKVIQTQIQEHEAASKSSGNDLTAPGSRMRAAARHSMGFVALAAVSAFAAASFLLPTRGTVRNAPASSVSAP